MWYFGAKAHRANGAQVRGKEQTGERFTGLKFSLDVEWRIAGNQRLFLVVYIKVGMFGLVGKSVCTDL